MKPIPLKGMNQLTSEEENHEEKLVEVAVGKLLTILHEEGGDSMTQGYIISLLFGSWLATYVDDEYVEAAIDLAIQAARDSRKELRMKHLS